MIAYGRTMAEVTERVASRWPTGVCVSLHADMQRITLEVILRTVFGVEATGRLDELADALTAILDKQTSVSGALSMVPLFQHEARGLSPFAAFRRLLVRADTLILRRSARGATSGPAAKPLAEISCLCSSTHRTSPARG